MSSKYSLLTLLLTLGACVNEPPSLGPTLHEIHQRCAQYYEAGWFTSAGSLYCERHGWKAPIPYK